MRTKKKRIQKNTNKDVQKVVHMDENIELVKYEVIYYKKNYNDVKDKHAIFIDATDPADAREKWYKDHKVGNVLKINKVG